MQVSISSGLEFRLSVFELVIISIIVSTAQFCQCSLNGQKVICGRSYIEKTIVCVQRRKIREDGMVLE